MFNDAVEYIKWLVDKANKRGTNFIFKDIPGKGYAFEGAYRRIYVRRNDVYHKRRKSFNGEYPVQEIRKEVLKNLWWIRSLNIDRLEYVRDKCVINDLLMSLTEYQTNHLKRIYSRNIEHLLKEQFISKETDYV